MLYEFFNCTDLQYRNCNILRFQLEKCFLLRRALSLTFQFSTFQLKIIEFRRLQFEIVIYLTNKTQLTEPEFFNRILMQPESLNAKFTILDYYFNVLKFHFLMKYHFSVKAFKFDYTLVIAFEIKSFNISLQLNFNDL